MTTEHTFADEPTTSLAKPDSLLTSLRAQLASELASEVKIEPLTLKVDTRPHLTLRYNPDVDIDKVRAWQKSSRRNRRIGNRENIEIDPLKFSLLVVKATSIGILFDGQEVDNGDGATPLTLRDRDLLQFTGQMDDTAAILHLFGTDSQLLLHGQQILAAAGYDADGSALEVEEGDDPLA